LADTALLPSVRSILKCHTLHDLVAAWLPKPPREPHAYEQSNRPHLAIRPLALFRTRQTSEQIELIYEHERT
jgi:hypothetical protein